MSVSDTVRRDSKSYRQGMVLGLTMAETLLLLVFCLLLAAASVIAHQFQEAQEEQQFLRDALREARNKIDVMQSQMPEGVIDDNFKHLVRDYPHIDKLMNAGITLKEAGDNADTIAQVLQVQKAGSDVTGSIVLGEAVKKEFQNTTKEVPKDDEIVAILREGMRAKASGGKGEHDWPPIILLNELKDYYFDSGSAVLSDKFLAGLSGPVMKELLGIIAKYPRASVIEVIGHTDEQRIIGSSSNLDETLVPVIRRKEPIIRLKPADNAGLGLARAVAVSQVLLQDERLEGFAILPYSGGQLVNVGDVLVLSGGGGDERERRRIEIRVREPNKVSVPSAAADPTTVAPSPQRPSPAPRVTPKQSDSTVVQSQEPPQPVKPKPRSEPDDVRPLFPFGRFFRN